MKYLVIGGVVIVVVYLVAGAYIFGKAAEGVTRLNDQATPTTLGRINLSGNPFSSSTPTQATV